MIAVAWWCARRLVMIPVMVLLAVGALVVWVVTVVGSLLLEPPYCLYRRHSPRWRANRLVTFAVLYTWGELVCLVACLVLWPTMLSRTAGLQAHRRLLAVFLGGVVLASRLVFGFRLTVREPDGDLGIESGDEPVVVLARHAGPGASFALIHLLAGRYRRDVKIVLKQVLRLDPSIDVLLTRLGCAWMTGHSGGVEKVGELAGSLQGRDALVLFPEGADWTPVRQLEAVARLRGRGLFRQARVAIRMPHVLPPRPAGTLAAVAASPASDVLVFTHTGLDRLLDVVSTWRALPLRQPLTMTWWRVPAGDVPRDSEDAVADWLQDTWQQIDTWVEQRQDRQA